MGALAQTVGISSAQSGLWERYVRPPHPDHSNPRWHVSPLIDLAAYHFSWAWALVPMMLLGTWDSAIYCVYALVMGANLAHRHYGLPYAYFDGGVFRTFERKLTLFPQICILMLAATPLSLSQRAGWIGAGAVGAVVFFSLLWNFWHVYMQKYGILRLYQAKDPAPVQRQGPAWVDKYFILCWIPLYLSYLVPKYKDLILANGTNVAGPLSIIGFMEKYERWLVAPTAAIAAGGVALWLWWEWRTHRYQNRPRLCAATGTLFLSTAMFWANPVEVYIAFGFSHAVEYMVFVWAFQRRRYCRPRPAPSLMERVLRYPKTWYLGFTLTFAAIGTTQVLWGRLIMHGVRPMLFFGLTGSLWLFYYAVYESLVHFYMDGFLWKMRRPDVRENI
jgi:hypothetical protein